MVARTDGTPKHVLYVLISIFHVGQASDAPITMPRGRKRKSVLSKHERLTDFEDDEAVLLAEFDEPLLDISSEEDDDVEVITASLIDCTPPDCGFVGEIDVHSGVVSKPNDRVPDFGYYQPVTDISELSRSEWGRIFFWTSSCVSPSSGLRPLSALLRHPPRTTRRLQWCSWICHCDPVVAETSRAT